MRGTAKLGTLVAALTSIAAPVSAEELVITAQSAPAYNVSKALMRRGDGPLTVEDAALFERAIMVDTQVDAAERAMLDALIAGTPYTIKPASFGSDVHFTRIASEEARAALRAITSLSHDDPLLQDWMDPAAVGVERVVQLYQSGETGRDQVLGMLGNRANEVARQGWENDYKKLRSEMLVWSGKCRQLASEAYRACRRMIYEGIVTGDKNGRDNTVGNIPDDIYKTWAPEQD